MAVTIAKVGLVNIIKLWKHLIAILGKKSASS